MAKLDFLNSSNASLTDIYGKNSAIYKKDKTGAPIKAIEIDAVTSFSFNAENEMSAVKVENLQVFTDTIQKRPEYFSITATIQRSKFDELKELLDKQEIIVFYYDKWRGMKNLGNLDNYYIKTLDLTENTRMKYTIEVRISFATFDTFKFNIESTEVKYDLEAGSANNGMGEIDTTSNDEIFRYSPSDYFKDISPNLKGIFNGFGSALKGFFGGG